MTVVEERGRRRDSSVDDVAVLLHNTLNVEDLPAAAKLKADELLFNFLSLSSSQTLIEGLVKDMENGIELADPTASLQSFGSSVLQHLSSNVPSSPRRLSAIKTQLQAVSSPPRSPRGKAGFLSPQSPRSPPNPNSPRSPGSPQLSQLVGAQVRLKLLGNKELVDDAASVKEAKEVQHQPQQQQTQPHPRPQTQEQVKHVDIPRFYHPVLEVSPESARAFQQELDRYFEGTDESGFAMNDFVSICKDLCNFPTFFNGPLCRRIRQVWESDHGFRDVSEEKKEKEESREESLYISRREFEHFWRTEMEPYDEQDRFFRLLKQPSAEYIVSSDFAPYLEELLAYHPGLEFLESTEEFQEKYARTVIARIMYEVNTSWNGSISRRELRRSDLLKVFHEVDEEEDINLVLRYFSYEHFYTLYVKFWELDTDHDFEISQEDLMRHGGHSLTPAIVERIFQQPVYSFFSNSRNRMGFEDFCFFFLSEEDKTNPISLRYWFRCVDLDGDGVITAWEMRHFYEQQVARLQSYGHEVISFEDVVCQAHDFVHPAEDGAFRLEDFCNERVMHISGTLFNMLFNLNKFIAFEQRDPYYVRQMHENPHLTEWDRFAAVEYARLASAEEEREMEEESFASWGGSSSSSFQRGEPNSRNWFKNNESPF